MLKLYKLNLSRVHFGNGLLDDTVYSVDSARLFSALCHEALQQGGDVLKNFQSTANTLEFRISDTFPYLENADDTDYFLPKPLILAQNNDNLNDEDGRKQAKQAKKLMYISVNDYANFVSEQANLTELTNKQQFGKSNADVKVALTEFPDNVKERSNPYSVGVYSFKENAGLYFIAQFPDELPNGFIDKFEQLLEGLQYSSIGGKRTAGYGKFKLNVVDESEFPNAFRFSQLANSRTIFSIEVPVKSQKLKDAVDCANQVLISSAVPKLNEIEMATDSRARYLLAKSSGFTYSQTGGKLLRKRNLYKFRPGSIAHETCTWGGDIFDVAPDDYPHDVLNYAKAMWFKLDVQVNGGVQ